MLTTHLDEAIREAERFLAKAKALRKSATDPVNKLANHATYIQGSKESGATRRASMDLTRALAKLRSSS